MLPKTPQNSDYFWNTKANCMFCLKSNSSSQAKEVIFGKRWGYVTEVYIAFLLHAVIRIAQGSIRCLGNVICLHLSWEWELLWVNLDQRFSIRLEVQVHFTDIGIKMEMFGFILPIK